MPFYLKVLIVILLIIIFEIYFVKKVISSIKILFPNISPKKIKWGKLIGLVLVNAYPLTSIITWLYILITKDNNFSFPQNVFTDYLMMYPFWVGTIIVLQSILIFLILDVLKLILFPLYKKWKEKIKKPEAVFFFVLISFFVIYVPSRIIYDHNTVLIRTTEFNKSNIPDDLENFRIIFISDVQADRYTNNERLSNFIEKVNSTNPDLVLIAGDVITGGSDYINTSAEFIGKIKSKYGIYSCVGDHDNWAYRFDNARSRREITEALAAKNISMIDDDTLNIKINNAKIGITFITNTYVESIALTKLDRIASYNNDADLKIFLTHQPRQHLLDKAIEKNYDLFLAGHTHGGQITFLFPFYNLSPTLSETTYMRGDFYFGNLLMIVTRGLGMSLSPIRYNSTPEVTEIIIHKK